MLRNNAGGHIAGGKQSQASSLQAASEFGFGYNIEPRIGGTPI